MVNIAHALKNYPLVAMHPGEIVLEQGSKTGRLFFLMEGSVVVQKDGIEIAVCSDKGAVFGEMSLLMNVEHIASVLCETEAKFYVIDFSQQFLDEHPEIVWHIAQVLSLRLFNLTQYMVDIKTQYEGHEHMEMVREVITVILEQQKTHIVHREDSSRETPEY